MMNQITISDPVHAPEPDSGLISSDLSPFQAGKRTFTGLDMAGLWLGLVVNVPSYYLAGSLVDLGMSWWQGVATIVAGNTIILLPLPLTSHPGARYGISFPVLLRSSFGVRGAHFPALLRALVACGWCGIETWIGGQALLLLPPSSLQTPFAIQFACFVIFLIIQLGILWKGMAGIKSMEKFSAPVLLILIGWLFFWAYSKAGGFGEMLSAPSRLTPSEFWLVFFPSLTASISNWSGLALNIPDFTRYSRSQADQIAGQLGLPVFMGLYTFAGLAITSSTEVIYGRPISNPIELLYLIGGTFTAILAIVGVGLATVTTNIPANFVAPANVLVSLAPSKFNFIGGCLATGFVSMAFQPWKILGSSENFVYTWLVGYSAILGPISGTVLTDYYLLGGMDLDVDALYSADPLGSYYYNGGYNVVAFVALIFSVVPAVRGFFTRSELLERFPEFLSPFMTTPGSSDSSLLPSCTSCLAVEEGELL